VHVDASSITLGAALALPREEALEDMQAIVGLPKI